MDLDYTDPMQGQQRQPVSSGVDPSVMVRFYLRPVQNKQRSKKEGRPIFEEQEFIQIRAPGSRDFVDRPIRPKDKERWAQQYAHWKSTNENKAVSGLLLSEWPKVTASQVEELKFDQCFTVEQLASMPDDRISRHRGGLQLKETAKRWIEMSKMDAPLEQLQALVDEKEARIARLEEQMQKQTELIEKLSAEAPAPKRRGRPPKAKVEE